MFFHSATRCFVQSPPPLNDSLELSFFVFASLQVGVIGTGKIGRAVSSILLGMGCEVIAHDVKQSEDALRLGVR
eukprot:6205316-Pleurochrysis_carterae.AAC.1